MNIREFKEFINQFPDDATVEVFEMVDEGYSGSYIRVIEFKGEEYQDYEYIDFTGNQFVKPDAPHYNKRFIRFGKER